MSEQVAEFLLRCPPLPGSGVRYRWWSLSDGRSRMGTWDRIEAIVPETFLTFGHRIWVKWSDFDGR